MSSLGGTWTPRTIQLAEVPLFQWNLKQQRWLFEHNPLLSCCVQAESQTSAAINHDQAEQQERFCCCRRDYSVIDERTLLRRECSSTKWTNHKAMVCKITLLERVKAFRSRGQNLVEGSLESSLLSTRQVLVDRSTRRARVESTVASTCNREQEGPRRGFLATGASATNVDHVSVLTTRLTLLDETSSREIASRGLRQKLTRS